MKIATYNINGIIGRLPVLLRWLEMARPDVVCLQELKAEGSRFPEAVLKKSGYNAIWWGEKTWNGVAILSRTEIRHIRNDLPEEDETYHHSRYIEGFTAGIVIGCLYLPNGNPYPGPKFDYKLRWFKRLAVHAQTLLDTGLPVMLVGDFNVMPTELDTYKPEKYLDNALFRPESRAEYSNLIRQGWTDAIRKLYPNERIYTFWDYLRSAYSRDAGLRLDHFLLNPELAARLHSGGVDKEVRGWEKSSDHAPAWIELGENLQEPTDSTNSVYSKEVKALLDAAPESGFPKNIRPMKATRVDKPFNEPGWVYEIKWDGYRALAMVQGGKAELLSGKNIVFDHFPQINNLLSSWGMDVVLDGEIVLLNEIGIPDSGALQDWKSEEHLNLVFYVFDILWFNGRLLTDYTLLQRRKILEAVLPKEDGLIRISHIFDADGVAFYESAKRMKLEGIIAKRAESNYTANTRSQEWLVINEFADGSPANEIRNTNLHIDGAVSDSKQAGLKRKMPEKPLLDGKQNVAEKEIDGHILKFTNLNKLYWPEDKITKRDLFNYYDQVAPYMVPYLLDRPMSLNRFPGGIHGHSFYQKNVKETAPSWARTMPHTNEKGEEKEYLLGYDRATLLWMATLGCIEMNPWFSRVQSPDNPDFCVIDLDPDKNTFEQVIEAAQVTKSVLDGMGVPSYVKTSGSTGIHIYVPLGAKYTYDQSQLFAQVVVKLVHRELPSYTTLERMIANRKGKMYLDFMQNRPGATIAGVYSLRPKPGATVSMPLHWDEVKPGLTMRDFTIHNALARLRETGDLFTGVLGDGIDMVMAIEHAKKVFD